MSGKSRWGSLLQGAVAGIESRLDTILTDDPEASAKSRAAEEAAKQKVREETAAARGAAPRAEQDTGASRPPSRTRANGRLQDRLAKVIAKGADGQRSSRASLELQSQAAPSPTTLTVETSRESLESRESDAPHKPAPQQPEIQDGQEEMLEEKQLDQSASDHLLASQDVVKHPSGPSTPALDTPGPSLPVRQSQDSSSSRPSIDYPTRTSESSTKPMHTRTSSSYESELAEQRSDLHAHLERIDALQSKVAYLAKAAAESAKDAAAESDASSLERKIAGRDEQIAQLLDEGQKLSKNELKHLSAIKKLRAQLGEEERGSAELKKKLAKADKAAADAAERARRAEAQEKEAREKLKVVAKIEKDVEGLQMEREAAIATIAELGRQVEDAQHRAEEAERRAQVGNAEAERKVVIELREELEDAKIEKKLAEDRARAEARELKEEAERLKERARTIEMELKGEIANMETKLEVLRSRTEEASSSATSDTQAKLLRQIETLQTQYALASENWQGIESALTSRVAALEKERDEAAKRESDMRRRAREVNSKCRRLEEELEMAQDSARTVERDLQEQRAQVQKLQACVSRLETALVSARAEFEHEKKIMQTDFQQRMEEEKIKWRLEHLASTPSLTEQSASFLRADSPVASSSRKQHSTSDLVGLHARRSVGRFPSSSSELPLSPLPMMDTRPPSRRTSIQPARTPDTGTPPLLSQVNGILVSQPPSIHTIDRDEAFENTSSPHRTINDMVSVSTIAAGPSVQLVERMSAAVRRLESEKAASKEEMARLTAQRDEARAEVVALMQEVEQKRVLEVTVDKLRKQLADMDERYQTTLEMLGEKSEMVEELQNDVLDLKKIYRELVDSTMK